MKIATFLLALVATAQIGFIYIQQDKIAADELALASGIVRWEIKIPSDLNEEEFLATAWYDENDFIKYECNFHGFNRGETAITYLWTHRSDEYLKFTIINYNDEATAITHAKLNHLDGFDNRHSHATTGAELALGKTILTIQNDARERRYLKIVKTNTSKQFHSEPPL